MIHDATESKRLLSVLRDRPVSVDPAREEARRLRSLPRLDGAVRVAAERRRRKKQRRVLVGWLAAIVATAVAGVGIRELIRVPAAPPGAAIRALDGHLTHEIDGAERAVSPGDSMVLPVAGEVRTNASSDATLETSRGLRLHLQSSSRLGLSGLSPNGLDGSVRLEQGEVQCAVPKLQGGARFSVVTPNARVVVHGTRFTVRVETLEAGVTRTCVRVIEGVVAVEQASAQAVLHAGDEWGCGVPHPSVEAARAVKTAPPVLRVRPAAPAARVQGTLADETALLQTALAAERQGRPAAASAAATRLISRYPESPLLPEARAVLDRVSERPRDGR